MLGVNLWLILHHFHTLSPTTLLTAVLTDHIQLPDPVLESEERVRMMLRMGNEVKTEKNY